MEPGGSELDSSLPQPENPCLIVEDSQPDSVALEDDPESSYRALLARRLSSLQPSPRSPVLELIASPPSICSQSGSQSENNSHHDYQAELDSCSAFQEESQVLSICPLPQNKRCSSETDMESGADSTTNCQSEEGNSQFGFLALSQSQDLCAEAENCHDSSQTHDLMQAKLDTNKSGPSESQGHKALRSEVSSSSSSEHQSGRQLSVQDLLHSESLQNSCELEQQDCNIQSSQQDMFDTEKTGAAVDSTVSEPEQQGLPTSTPAQTLHLLHLSGHETLVQESLSQSSIDCIAPTPDDFNNTPLIIPSSPTEPENEPCADEPMDTSQPLEGREAEKEGEPMETGPASKPQPSASTPLSQNCPGFQLERTLSLPSQPEFSHDVFAANQSPQQSDKKSPSLPLESQSQQLESASFALPLQLSSHLESSSSAAKHSEDMLEDSQATQIEEVDGEFGVDTSDSVVSGHDHRTNGESSQSQTGIVSKTPAAAEAPICSVNVKDSGSVATVSCSQSKLSSSDLQVSLCVQETPSSQSSPPLISQKTETDVAKESVKVSDTTQSDSQEKRCDTVCSSQNNNQIVDSQEEVMEEEVTETMGGDGPPGMALVLSQSQMLTPEPMDEQEENMAKDGEDEGRLSQALPLKTNDGSLVSTNGHKNEKINVPETEGLKDKSLSDSSGEISFHFTLPKEGESMGPAVAAATPLISQLKRSHRHSTPIEMVSFSEKSEGMGDVSVDVATATGDVGPGDDGGSDKEEGKLSLRMKLVTPVEEGSSERFSLQKPSLSEEDGPVAKVTTDIKAIGSPSVFTRVREVHRPQETMEDGPATENVKLVRGELFASPQILSQSSSLGCNSLPNSQQEPPENVKASTVPPDPSEEVPSEPAKAEARRKMASQQCPDKTSSPSNNKHQHRSISQQTSFDAAGSRSPANKGDTETPTLRRPAGPAHRRHVRTIQEVRTTITRIITDVYYEDGREVDRKVTEESEEPVVDCQVLDGDISPCRTGSSLTSGDLADISSLSSKASSMHHSSGGTSSSTGPPRSEFIIPNFRGAKSSRGRGGSLQQLGAHPLSSSEDEPYARLHSQHNPLSPTVSELLRSSPEQARSCSNSLVGLRVVAKWSSNGYFYSGRIIKDAGEGRFRLRFDDGYECEVPGKDVLLCDPIPLETEVTALLEDEYFSVGVVKGYKTEGQDLFYSVEKDGQKQWYNRTSVILSLEQGNRLREQHSLGPYEPSTPLAKASDISLDNLVEGKRRRRIGTGGPNTPTNSSSASPRTPGTSFKRKAVSSDDEKTPAKRGRRLPASKAGRLAQRVGVCNTSGSGTDLPGQSDDLAETHGPLPENTSLFMGFAFMLTASSESDRLTNRFSSEDDEDYVQTGPFNKKYTESQLQAGGGFILPDFNEEQCKAAYQSLLIADQHCRTRKYLLCLASGVPCVSHIWVRDCCRDNKLLNYRNYLLPAGVGPDETPVEWHSRCSPFKSLKILLVFEKPEELLAQLATMGGASSTRHFQPDKDGTDVPAGKFDVVLMDQSCPASLQETVTSQKIPLVSAEWLIQSLITGERQDFDSKPQYRHNYSTTTPSSSPLSSS